MIVLIDPPKNFNAFLGCGTMKPHFGNVVADSMDIRGIETEIAKPDDADENAQPTPSSESEVPWLQHFFCILNSFSKFGNYVGHSLHFLFVDGTFLKLAT